MGIRRTTAGNSRVLPHDRPPSAVLWTPQGYYECSPVEKTSSAGHSTAERNSPADSSPPALRNIYYRPDAETGDTNTSTRPGPARGQPGIGSSRRSGAAYPGRPSRGSRHGSGVGGRAAPRRHHLPADAPRQDPLPCAAADRSRAHHHRHHCCFTAAHLAAAPLPSLVRSPKCR